VFVRQERARQRHLPIGRMCGVLGISRATAYRAPTQAADDEMALRDAIQRFALANTAYGYRNIVLDLRDAGWQVGARKVRRLMRLDNLLALRRRKSWIRYRPHGLPLFENLARDFTPTGIDQLWVADLTYIRLRTRFVYLASWIASAAAAWAGRWANRLMASLRLPPYAWPYTADARGQA